MTTSTTPRTISTPENDVSPPTPRVVRGARRSIVVLAVTAVAALLLSGCFLTSTQEGAFAMMNRARGANGRSHLGAQFDAQVKAQAWAERLARENRLYHSNLASGIRVRWCGLAENVGYATSRQAVTDNFMRSSAHRANMLSSQWNGAGIGVAKRGNRVFVVQVFIRTC
jgi:uncharacterized protein YkwD